MSEQHIDSFKRIDNVELRQAIMRFSFFLRQDYIGDGADDYKNNAPDVWVPDVPGRDVVRILHIGRSQRSSYCFIVLRDMVKGGKEWKAGDILMAASWKAPAWNKPRGNVIANDYGKATWAGPGYL